MPTPPEKGVSISQSTFRARTGGRALFSRALWALAEQGGVFSRAFFLWTIVFLVNLLVFVVLTRIIQSSEISHDLYLSSLQLSFLRQVVAFYLIATGLGYLALLILKYTQGWLSNDLLSSGIFLACLNFVQICHFFGGIFVLIAPIFLLITVTNVGVFLSPRLGRYALAVSVILYFGTVVLRAMGYLRELTVILPEVTVSQVFNDPTLVVTFTIILGGALVIFESLIIEIVTVKNRNTEQTRQLNRQLVESNRRLAEMDGLKNDFLSMVSHDLRTPLTGILAYARILRNNENLDPQRTARYLDIMIEQGDRLNRLVDDLLDLQRFEEGKMTMEFQELPLNELVHQAVDGFMGAAEQTKVELREVPAPDPIKISGNRDRLLQVLSNLIANAIKFSPREGVIEIRVATEQGTGRPSARVSIKDSGPGIREELQDRLFQKYQRDPLLVQGTGIGLALVKEIVEAHQGRVGVESEPGSGSVFYFVLPLSR